MEIHIKNDVDSRVARISHWLFRSRRVGTIALLAIVTIPLSIYAANTTKPHTFAGDDIVSASKINENFDTLYQKINSIDAAGAPIGSILAFHKSLTGVPNLPEGWVECNGQTIADGDSPLNGQTLPDLNTTRRFLRGATTSGTDQVYYFRAMTIDTDGSNGTPRLASETRPTNMAIVWIIRIK